MQRRTFSRAFKIEAVKLVTERGVAVAQACRELDLSESAKARLEAPGDVLATLPANHRRAKGREAVVLAVGRQGQPHRQVARTGAVPDQVGSLGGDSSRTRATATTARSRPAQWSYRRRLAPDRYGDGFQRTRTSASRGITTPSGSSKHTTGRGMATSRAKPRATAETDPRSGSACAHAHEANGADDRHQVTSVKLVEFPV